MTTPDTVAASTSTASPQPRRGLGITSLVLALVPVLLALIFVVLAATANANDDTGWAILGWTILGVYVVAPTALILSGIALGLGIAAVRKNRGRGPGIVGTVIGSLDVVLVLVLVGSILWGAAL
jgi:ABC-type spermidine/putrescine transport system permease subunit II